MPKILGIALLALVPVLFSIAAMPPRRLVEYPAVLVHVSCTACPRRGRYKLARLAEKHGADALLDDVLRAIVGGCRELRCGARFDDLPPPTPSLPPPVTGVVLRRHGPPREVLPPRGRR